MGTSPRRRRAAVIAPTTRRSSTACCSRAFLPGRPVFAIDTFVAKKLVGAAVLRLFEAMPVDPTNPLSIRAMIRAVESGTPA
jgi:acyl-[acyl-carrier-protein]-phospholipid O-acyltransferase/long-chain-fatty-acid--[acyl-carrier-protein] ligase